MRGRKKGGPPNKPRIPKRNGRRKMEKPLTPEERLRQLETEVANMEKTLRIIGDERGELIRLRHAEKIGEMMRLRRKLKK